MIDLIDSELQPDGWRMNHMQNTITRMHRSLGQSLDPLIARSADRSIARSMGRSLGRSLAEVDDTAASSAHRVLPL